jgi:hypothetical protein
MKLIQGGKGGEDPRSGRGQADPDVDYDMDEEEEPRYLLVGRHDDASSSWPKYLSACILISPSPAVDEIINESVHPPVGGQGISMIEVDFKLPEALIGKKLTPKQLEKFKAILNDEGRWAELIKELGE